MVIKNPPKISPGLIFGGGGLIIGMIFVLRIRGGGLFSGGGLIFGGGGLIIGILRYINRMIHFNENTRTFECCVYMKWV